MSKSCAATPRQLEGSSRVLNPDIFVLTNIGHGHLGNYGGSREFILYEKLAVDRHAKDDAVGVVNKRMMTCCASHLLMRLSGIH